MDTQSDQRGGILQEIANRNNPVMDRIRGPLAEAFDLTRLVRNYSCCL